QGRRGRRLANAGGRVPCLRRGATGGHRGVRLAAEGGRLMRVVRLEMTGFRRHAGPVTYHLDAPVVTIRGDNGRGKTTIAEAITYALFGTDLSGSPRVDRLIHQGAKGMEVAVVVRTADG